MTTVTDKQVIEQHLDREMLERPHLWPEGTGVIFVKRSKDGTVLAQTGPCTFDEDGCYVIQAHDWQAENAPAIRAMSYRSAEAVVADGWEVD